MRGIVGADHSPTATVQTLHMNDGLATYMDADSTVEAMVDEAINTLKFRGIFTLRRSELKTSLFFTSKWSDPDHGYYENKYSTRRQDDFIRLFNETVHEHAMNVLCEHYNEFGYCITDNPPRVHEITTLILMLIPQEQAESEPVR